jgi:hypothetical protein
LFCQSSCFSRRFLILFIAFFVLSSELTACGNGPVGSLFASRSQETPFLPPTQGNLTASLYQEPQLTLTPTAEPTESSRPTPLPACKDGLTFVEDVNYPDGSVVAPGEGVEKIWQVKNSGSCNWDVSYRLMFMSGTEMGAGEEQALYPARSGTQTALQVNFLAPQEPGRYRSTWQAVNPHGDPFGDLIYIEIVVDSSLQTAIP